ncbi:MAG: hypothetical protein M3303_14065 [Gemmatimonadota bacterium]|nr:hypothetical protein [Gemmatimonadota bacterium]
MIGSSSAERLVNARDANYRQPFLTTHRALAACTRELARLSDEVVLGVTALPGVNAEQKPVVRQSPDRCIVQFGPVALTLAWLRNSHDSIATGELLVIVWRGAVAPRKQHQPERPVTGPTPLPATALWEQVFTAVGDSEANWAWQQHGTDVGQCSSTELAARCVERLGAAYVDAASVA